VRLNLIGGVTTIDDRPDMRDNRGVLYSPDVVDACIRLFRDKKFTFE